MRIYQSHFEEGIKLYSQRKYSAAFNKFKAALGVLEWANASAIFPALDDWIYKTNYLAMLVENDRIKDWISKGDFEQAFSASQGLAKHTLDYRVHKFLNQCEEIALVSFQKSSYYGFKNKKDGVVIPAIYDAVQNFEYGRAGVCKEGYWAIINRNGELTTGFEFDQIFSIRESCTIIKKKNKFNLIEPEGNILLTGWYDYICSIRTEGLRRVKQNEKWGYIDSKGQLVIPPDYEEARFFWDGFAKVKKNGKYGYIDRSGSIVIPCQYQDSGYFAEGMAPVKVEDKWGFIDTSDNFVIPPIYEDTYGFYEEGLAGVQKDNFWGAINGKGDTVLPFLYDMVYPCKDGLIGVKIGEEYHWMNNKGVMLGRAEDYYFDERHKL